MSILRRLQIDLGLKPDPASHSYELNDTLFSALEDLAQQQQRPTSEVISDLLANGLDQCFSEEDLIKHWRSLSPREQDVAALAALGYTNRQIAIRLHISAETVKTHLGNVLVKFNLHSRSELSMLLSKWDFSAWEHQ